MEGVHHEPVRHARTQWLGAGGGAAARGGGGQQHGQRPNHAHPGGRPVSPPVGGISSAACSPLRTRSCRLAARNFFGGAGGGGGSGSAAADNALRAGTSRRERRRLRGLSPGRSDRGNDRSEEHTSELQSLRHL